MSQISALSPLVSRTVQVAGLVGILIGLFIGSVNSDSLGWTLLRGSILGVAFAWAARRAVLSVFRAWLESKIESLRPVEGVVPAVAQPNRTRK
jgi:hypothetical protein